MDCVSYLLPSDWSAYMQEKTDFQLHSLGVLDWLLKLCPILAVALGKPTDWRSMFSRRHHHFKLLILFIASKIY